MWEEVVRDGDGKEPSSESSPSHLPPPPHGLLTAPANPSFDTTLPTASPYSTPPEGIPADDELPSSRPLQGFISNQHVVQDSNGEDGLFEDVELNSPAHEIIDYDGADEQLYAECGEHTTADFEGDQ